MSDQRPPAHTRASREYDYSEGRHPSDDLLLASVRQQHLDNRIQIEQHINECPFCRQKCRVFEQDGRLLSPYMQQQQFYPSITNRVMQQIALENSLSRQERIMADLRRFYKYSLLEGIVQKVLGQERRQAENGAQGLFVSPLSPLTDEPLPGPFAALQAGGALRSGPASSRRSAPRSFRRPIIALVVVAAVLTLMIGLFASPVLRPSTANHAQPTPPAIPRQHNTPIPTKPKNPPTQTKTPGPANSGPQIVFCSTQSQLRHNIIQICGSGFTKYGRVWLTVYGFNVIFPRTADGRGTIGITFTVNDCRFVPLQITAFDASSRRVATLTVPLNSCSSSRHH